MDFSTLNPKQLEAVQTLEGPLLILAGAGSGKTRTLTCRIANLLEHGVPAWRILALTFTNKAAREMQTRVEKLVGPDMAADMWIGTFHSVCVRILRRDIEKLGYKRSFTIYDDDDQLRVIKDLNKKLNIDDKYLPPKEIRREISSAKNKLMTADEWFAQSDKSRRSQLLHDVFSAYDKTLMEYSALDFDDLLSKTLQLFMDHPPVLEYYQRKFQHILVDEYQDTNYVQYEFVRLLSDVSRNLCVVGDDDQSIYGWRGADIRNILEFEKDFDDVKVIKLEQNYRSTANILDAANQVIAHNEGRKEKVLWTEAPAGEKIQLYTAGDERDEAAWICERVRQLAKGGMPYGEMAVLYRSHPQSRVIEEMFVRSGLPYRVFGGTRFYDRREIKDALAYLRVIVNPADTVSLKRIINTPKRSIGDATVAQLEAEAARQEVPLFSVLPDPPEALSSRPRRCVSAFAELMLRLAAEQEDMGLADFVTHVLDETGLSQQLDSEDAETYEARRDNLRELISAVREYEDKTGDHSLSGYLENVSLITDLDRQEDAPQYVTLMTLHAAKGLEYDAVFIAGMEENLFPSYRAVTEDGRLEEERRLAYVGITRAKKILFLSCARQRTFYNQVNYNAPSMFLKEIPDRLINDVQKNARQRFGEEPGRTRVPVRPPRPTDFGVPGMGQKRDPLSIPGVSKGFVASAARPLSGSALLGMYKPGDRVIHRKFGEGTVEKVWGKGGEARISISFTAYGVKEFSLSIAPIIKVES